MVFRWRADDGILLVAFGYPHQLIKTRLSEVNPHFPPLSYMYVALNGEYNYCVSSYQHSQRGFRIIVLNSRSKPKRLYHLKYRDKTFIFS